MTEQDEKFLPEKIEIPVLPVDWNPEESVKKIKSLTGIVKPRVETIVHEFWLAHEEIVNKKWEGWTWGRFCEEAGYHQSTPYRWFEKYRLEITKTGGMAFASLEKTKEAKPLKKLTNPETKFKLEEVAKAIKKEEISDDDLKTVGDALADKIKEGVAAPRVGSRVATAVKNVHKENAVMKGGEKRSSIVDLFNRLQKCSEDLQLLIDGSIEINGKGDQQHYQAIRQLMPGYIYRAHKLGIDVLKVYNTFVVPHLKEGGKNESRTDENQKGQAIDVEFRSG